jgi:hypothetical protein
MKNTHLSRASRLHAEALRCASAGLLSLNFGFRNADFGIFNLQSAI